MIAVTWTALGVLATVSLGFMALLHSDIGRLGGRLDAQAARTDTKLDAQAARIDTVVVGLATLDSKISSLDAKVSGLSGEVAGLSLRVERLEHHPV